MIASLSTQSKVPAVRHRRVSLLGVIICISLCAGGLDLLQVVAWTGMVVTRCQQGTLSQSITTTFDGAHPCPLCTLIAQQRQQHPDRQAAVLQLMQRLGKVALVPAEGLSDLPAVATMTERDWSYRSTLRSLDDAAPPTRPPQV